MKVVVTGGAGFIGANLCKRLLSDPEVTEVVAFDDLSTGFRSNLDGVNARLEEGSILSPDHLARVLEGAASVVHLAARPSVPRSVIDPMASHVANATGTMNVLDAARNHGNVQVIVASSSSVYGSNPTLPKHEELATRPLSPYGASKLATEAYTVAYGSTYGMKTLAFRFFNVFGPLQAAGHAYAAVVPAFIDAALKGTPLEIHGDGTQSRDFTFVGTVADTIATAVTEQISSNGPVNLAFGTRTSLLDLISMLEDQLGTAVERNHVAVRTGDVPHSQAANERLLALIPGIASVSLEEGLRETINWFQSEAAHQTNG